MNAISEQTIYGRRRRRARSGDFKAKAVAACMRPSISMAAVARPTVLMSWPCNGVVNDIDLESGW
jgi:hypothetical protein